MAYTAYRVLRAPIDQVEAFMAKAIAEGWQPLCDVGLGLHMLMR